MNLLGWIKLIFDTKDLYNFVMNVLDSTKEVHNMGKGAFQNALLGNTPFKRAVKVTVAYALIFKKYLSI